MKHSLTKSQKPRNFLSGFNAALFLVVLLGAGAVFSNAFALTYLTNLYIGYEERFALQEIKLAELQNQIDQMEEQTAFYDDALKVYDAFEAVTEGRFDKTSAARYSQVIAKEAAKYDIDPLMVLAIVAAESSFRKEAVSHKGAMGLMQLLPSTAFYISEKIGHDMERPEELFDAEKNIRLGVAYFAYLIEKTGSTEHAIIAYNYGPGNLTKAIRENSRLPKKYVSTVMSYYKTITGAIEAREASQVAGNM